MGRRINNMDVPNNPIALLTTVFQQVFPVVNQELSYWEIRANEIPNKELQAQAKASIELKRFHCQGGAVFALLAGEQWKEAIRFIVAYQTISDYLDNLCDRSISLDPKDFSLLHRSMEDALTPGNDSINYYQFREDQEDNEYLEELVQTCQNTMRSIKDLNIIYPHMQMLEEMYSNLQVHKHVRVEERVNRLTDWFERNKDKTPGLTWYEFAAATGSTLGIFCLVSYALAGKMTKQLASNIYESYFPSMQALHILLDYFIDQKEDLIEKDLNFCTYYPNQKKMEERFKFFIEHTDQKIEMLPNSKFHKMIYQGLIGLYLADAKVRDLSEGKEIAKGLLQASGNYAKFFHWNIKLYNRYSTLSLKK